jgi:hypothetical protein
MGLKKYYTYKVMMENEKQLVIDNEGRTSYKIWSENLQRYYYKSKDKNYYNDYFHRTKKAMTCEICGKTVTCQLYSHKKSQKCRATQQSLELEKVKN